jgi:glucosamine kinase
MTGSLLIAEIGGSSSRWALLTEEDRVFPNGEGSLPGFNPLNGDEALFAEGVRAYFSLYAPDVFAVEQVQVYGAGCGTAERRQRMAEAIERVWPRATITVETDLLGAARGMCGDAAGQVLILGTGMNAGYYDGQHLHLPMPSLGYILGDEGSGADIGRVMLQDAFYGRMPVEVKEALFGPLGPELGAVLEEVYRSPFPARMLAARTALLADLLHHPYVRDLVLGRFHSLAELLKGFFPAEQRAEVHATGSVAFGFRELLSECLLDHGMTLVNVTKDPLRGLVQYARRS